MHQLWWALVESKRDADDIEAKDGCLRALFVDVHAGGAKNACALAGIHGLKRVAALAACARANLDEDAQTFGPDDQIELSLEPAPIAHQDCVPTLLQVASRKLLGSHAEGLFLGENAISHAEWRSPRSRTAG